MGPAKNNLAEFEGRKAPKPRKTRKFRFFSQNPAIWGIASRKRAIFDQVPYVLLLFLGKKSKLSGFGGGSMRTAAALHCRGLGHDIADFGVIWGRFFSIKN